MDGEAATLGHSANGFEQVFVRFCARLHVDHDIGRNHPFDGVLDGLAGGVGLFQAGRARYAHGHVDEIPLAGFAHADALALQHTFGFVHGVFDAFAQAVGRDVQQGVRRALTEARTDPDDYSGDDEGR